MRAVMIVVALTLLTGGCVAWRTQRLAPEGLTVRRPDVIRVEMNDGAQFELRDPEIVSDGLRGFVEGPAAGYPVAPVPRNGAVAYRLTVPTAEVRLIATRQVSVEKTVIAVVGTAAGWLLLLGALAFALLAWAG